LGLAEEAVYRDQPAAGDSQSDGEASKNSSPNSQPAPNDDGDDDTIPGAPPAASNPLPEEVVLEASAVCLSPSHNTILSGISDDEETVNSLESRDSYTRKGGRGGETGGMGISVFSTLLYVRSGFAARAERSEASGAERGERKEASETKPVPWRAKRA
jgi:hypothetical protein